MLWQFERCVFVLNGSIMSWMCSYSVPFFLLYLYLSNGTLSMPSSISFIGYYSVDWFSFGIFIRNRRNNKYNNWRSGMFSRIIKLPIFRLSSLFIYCVLVHSHSISLPSINSRFWFQYWHFYYFRVILLFA